MRALSLDFCRSRPAPKWIRPLLLAVALAFAADVGHSFFKSAGSLKKSEAALAKVQPREYRDAAARKVSAEEIAAARESVQRLSTPWEKLFGALESASSDNVALLAIEPDAKEGKVIISGDSKDYLAALTYVMHLGQAPSLSQVALARHEVKPHAVGFSVSAAWGK